MDVTPSRLFVGVRKVVGAEVDTHNIIRPKNLLDGSCDSGLGLPLRKIVGNQRRANSKLRWMASSSIPGDAHL